MYMYVITIYMCMYYCAVHDIGLVSLLFQRTAHYCVYKLD